MGISQPTLECNCRQSTHLYRKVGNPVGYLESKRTDHCTVNTVKHAVGLVGNTSAASVAIGASYFSQRWLSLSADSNMQPSIRPMLKQFARSPSRPTRPVGLPQYVGLPLAASFNTPTVSGRRITRHESNVWTRSSSVVRLAVSSLQITNRAFDIHHLRRVASAPFFVPSERRQPHPVHSPPR